MKSKPKVKQTEVKSVVRETVYLKDVDASNYRTFAQTLSADISIIDDSDENLDLENN